MNKHVKHNILLYLPFFCLLLSGVYAQNLTLQKALSLTLASNPDLKAFELQIQAKQALVKQSSLLPNPELEVELENFGMAEGAVVFSQLVELGGKRSRRIGVAEIDLESAKLEFEIQRLEILTETAEKYIQLWEAQEKQKYWQESVAIADSMLVIIKQRIQLGATPEIERIRAEVELAGITLKSKSSKKEYETAKVGLNTMWGGDAYIYDKLEELNTDKVDDLDTNKIYQKIPDCPQMLLQRSFIKKGKAELQLAKAEGYTDLEVSAGYKREGETNEHMAILGVSIGLPLFNRNQGSIQEARTGTKISVYKQTALNHKLHAILRELASIYQSQREETETIRKDILPRMEKAFGETQHLYQLGKTSFLDLLDMQRSLLEIKVGHVESLAQLQISRFQIEAILGTAWDSLIKGGK
ncbi:MAG: TolC family protein [Fibrobacteria bacterium]|nr:TolC family protein [Fibrobacteria bacterium]